MVDTNILVLFFCQFELVCVKLLIILESILHEMNEIVTLEKLVQIKPMYIKKDLTKSQTP